MYVYISLVIFWASWALGYQICALAAVVGSPIFSCNDPIIVSVELLIVLLVFCKLLFTVLKALRISADTFRANIAVSTRYIRLIIFCRGSLGSAICCGYFRRLKMVFLKVVFHYLPCIALSI